MPFWFFVEKIGFFGQFGSQIAHKIFGMAQRFFCVVDELLESLERIVQRIVVLLRSFGRHMTHSTLLFPSFQLL